MSLSRKDLPGPFVPDLTPYYGPMPTNLTDPLKIEPQSMPPQTANDSYETALKLFGSTPATRGEPSPPGFKQKHQKIVLLNRDRPIFKSTQLKDETISCERDPEKPFEQSEKSELILRPRASF